jgi:excisionase family DNA binding protein
MALQTSNRAAYSVPEIIALTGLGRDKIYRVIKEGKLTARKCGRRTLITAVDLQRFLESLPTMGRAAESASVAGRRESLPKAKYGLRKGTLGVPSKAEPDSSREQTSA